MSDCLTPDQVEGLLAGTLPPDEAARAEAHLADCSRCRRRFSARQGENRPSDSTQDAGQDETATASHGFFGSPGNSGDSSARPGERIPGYEILSRIHSGGQGVVYKAVQQATKRTVALKVLLQGPHASPRQRHRFEREIDLVAGLQHPHIVTVYDSGVTPDDRHYFAMEYIHGQPLDAYLSDARLGIDETLRLFGKICAAVNYAHQRGVIHRDLKPGNIRIDARGEPHVLDFGLAKAAGSDLRGGAPVTMTGEFMGTLAYASPEQTKGDPHLIDIRTDVYSLGVILYEMLTGKYPYQVVGQMAEVLRNIAEAEPRKPSTIRRQINNEVETIILKALAKERERRYQSAENLARDIEHYLSGEPIDAKRDSTWYVIRKSLRRYRLAVAVAAGFVVLLAGSTVALSIMYQNQNRARQEAEHAEREQNRARKEAEQARREAVDAQAAAEEARDGESRQRVLADHRYEEIIRLADLKRLADARAAADSLWPAHPEKIEAMETWLQAKAAPLRDNLPKHEATLQSLRDQALDYDPEQQKHDRQTHPKAAELAEQKQRLAELQKELDDVRAEESEDAEAQANKIEELEKTVAETEQSISELQEAVKERRTWKFPDDQTQWQHDTLAGLVEDLKAFVNPDPKKGGLASVQERLAFAESIEEQSITGPAAAAKWAEAIADIARLEVYGGLQIKPQLGLLPLRRDPRSGLWEFRHIQTGTKPEQNRARKEADAEAVNPWILTGDTGLIFVLIPGGTFWMGAQKDDPEGHNYDPQAGSDESPVHEVTLAAFFISKYEMTQLQWRRFTGGNPSRYGPSWSWNGRPPAEAPIHQNLPWNPVERVSWTDCRDVLGRLGLVLPTEAQWEYAARAGTDTVWWTGDDKESIGVEGAGNLADGWTKSKGGPSAWVYEDWLDDGWVVHAPVGIFSPNGFGLHDVIGNVWEWCHDGYGGYDADVQPGDGLRNVAGARDRVRRGGGFYSPAALARSAFRFNFTPAYRHDYLGVRPARVITE